MSARASLPWKFCLRAFGWLLLVGGAPLFAEAPAREFRGAWVSTVYNIDWPSKAGLPVATQQAQLRAIMDRAVELKLNALILQVRPASDALYASKLEPWSQFLSGKQGVSPGYDPLAFAVSEAHARGLELHAWFNPFRAATSASGPFAANHISRTKPAWVRTFGKQLWLDPGEPRARIRARGDARCGAALRHRWGAHRRLFLCVSSEEGRRVFPG
jgi:uncharacterized lipoprotein YddW (UPF0748 family)